MNKSVKKEKNEKYFFLTLYSLTYHIGSLIWAILGVLKP